MPITESEIHASDLDSTGGRNYISTTDIAVS